MTGKPDPGRFGVWVAEPVSGDRAREIEDLGYGAVWVGGSPSADLSFAEPILEQTQSLMVATGIVNIWSAAAEPVADSFHRIDGAYPGRFLLGIGVGHPEHTAEYRKPYDALVSYVDKLDAAGVPADRRVIAALGPKMLRLSAQRSAGAHPALVTPQHTEMARDVLGPDRILAPAQAVLISTDAPAARAFGRQITGSYLALGNYVNNWKRLGFTEDDLAAPGSDQLIDDLLAHGGPQVVARRLQDHLDAGADHVAIQVLAEPASLLPTLRELAGPLGLERRS